MVPAALPFVRKEVQSVNFVIFGRGENGGGRINRVCGGKKEREEERVGMRDNPLRYRERISQAETRARKGAVFLLSCLCFMFRLFRRVVKGAVGRSAVRRRSVEVVFRKVPGCLGWGHQVLYVDATICLNICLWN